MLTQSINHYSQRQRKRDRLQSSVWNSMVGMDSEHGAACCLLGGLFRLHRSNEGSTGLRLHSQYSRAHGNAGPDLEKKSVLPWTRILSSCLPEQARPPASQPGLATSPLLEAPSLHIRLAVWALRDRAEVRVAGWKLDKQSQGLWGDCFSANICFLNLATVRPGGRRAASG